MFVDPSNEFSENIFPRHCNDFWGAGVGFRSNVSQVVLNVESRYENRFRADLLPANLALRS